MTPQILTILESDKLHSGEKLEQLALYLPVCQHMQKMKPRAHWKLILEDVCVLLLQENLELKDQLLTAGTSLKIPVLGVVS